MIGGLHDWLSSKWGCDPVAMLAADKPIRFLGMEINLGEDGQSFELSQKGFIEELLHAQQVVVNGSPRPVDAYARGGRGVVARHRSPNG